MHACVNVLIRERGCMRVNEWELWPVVLLKRLKVGAA